MMFVQKLFSLTLIFYMHSSTLTVDDENHSSDEHYTYDGDNWRWTETKDWEFSAYSLSDYFVTFWILQP